MPVFSRLGPYDPGLVDDAAWTHSARRPRMLVEYWAHEASLLPVADWPLLLSGAKRAGWWRHYEALADREPGLVDELLAAVKELGPVGAGTLETALGAGAAAAARAPRGGRARTSSGSASTCSAPARSPPGRGCTSSGSTTCPSGCCPPRSSPRTRRTPRRRRGRWCCARPAPSVSRRSRTCATTTASGPRSRSRPSPNWSRPACWSGSTSVAGAIPRTGCPARRSRGGWRRGRCSRRSTR